MSFNLLCTTAVHCNLEGVYDLRIYDKGTSTQGIETREVKLGVHRLWQQHSLAFLPPVILLIPVQ